MADMTIVGYCPVCKAAMIEDEPRAACDYKGRTTGDYAEDIFDGTPQTHEGHPGCLTKVEPSAETASPPWVPMKPLDPPLTAAEIPF